MDKWNSNFLKAPGALMSLESNANKAKTHERLSGLRLFPDASSPLCPSSAVDVGFPASPTAAAGLE
jgi:hypothetical protein